MIYLHPSEVRWIYKGQFPFWYAYYEVLHCVHQDIQARLWRGI